MFEHLFPRLTSAAPTLDGEPPLRVRFVGGYVEEFAVQLDRLF
jgi:hypothetical protein